MPFCFAPAAVAGALALMIGQAYAAPPPPEPVTPQLIEAAKKEGKVVYYTAIDLKVAQGLAKNFETLYPGITVQVERTGSERIFQRAGAGARQQYLRGRRARRLRPGAVRDLEEARHARALYPGRGDEMAGRAARSRRHLCQRALHADADRRQHQSGEAGGRAEKLCRSARPEMGGQDRQGASELLGRHRHVHVPDREGDRLELFREARPAEGAAGAVGDRAAQEAGARRTRGLRRRARIHAHPPAGDRRADQDRLPVGRNAVHSRLRGHRQERRRIRTPPNCS